MVLVVRQIITNFMIETTSVCGFGRYELHLDVLLLRISCLGILRTEGRHRDVSSLDLCKQFTLQRALLADVVPFSVSCKMLMTSNCGLKVLLFRF